MVGVVERSNWDKKAMLTIPSSSVKYWTSGQSPRSVLQGISSWKYGTIDLVCEQNSPKNLHFEPPWQAHVRLRIRRLQMLVFQKDFAHILDG